MTFEMDGHGDNPRPLCCPGLDENLPAALAFLREQPDVDPNRVGILGVSLGGALAVNTATRDAGIKALVTVGLPHRVNMDEWQLASECLSTLTPEMWPTAFLRATPNRLLEWVTTPMRMAASPDHEHETADFLDPRTMKAVNRALRYLNPLDHVMQLKETPLLVINGEWDNVAPPWQALDLYERAAGPKALSLVPRRNHLTVMLYKPAVESAVHWFRRWL
jgi:fermentation-respiration switch protein FrsA (DUF1100 family)